MKGSKIEKMLKEQHPEIRGDSKHKYFAVKVEVGGMRFDSKREYYMYTLLNALKEELELNNIHVERQVPIVLQPTMKKEMEVVEFDKKLETMTYKKKKVTFKSIRVIPDFMVLRYGNKDDIPLYLNTLKTVGVVHTNNSCVPLLVIDVKGKQTQKSVLQMKMLNKMLPCPILLPKSEKDCNKIYRMMKLGHFGYIEF